MFLIAILALAAIVSLIAVSAMRTGGTSAEQMAERRRRALAAQTTGAAEASVTELPAATPTASTPPVTTALRQAS